jgi:hypothetical protein
MRKESPQAAAAAESRDVIQTKELEMPEPVAFGQKLSPQVINNGVKLIGEVLVPGASELIEGRIGKGVAAVSVGLGIPVLSAMVLGPVAAILVGGGTSLAVRALSFSDSLTPEKERKGFFDGKDKDAVDVLDERYAKGEVATDDYEERRKALLKHVR